MPSTICGSASSTSMEAGRGFMAIELVNDFAGAHGIAEVLQGFVFRGEVDALHARPLFSMAFMTVSMSDCSASSDTYAVMETLSSTDFTALSTIRPPTRKMPMMSRDRKIVIIEPSVVERFRRKARERFFEEVEKTRHRNRTHPYLGRGSTGRCREQ